MRIAVCISGAQRLANHALTYFSRNLPEDVTVDYFCYMWGGDFETEEALIAEITQKVEGNVGLIRARIDTEFTPVVNFPHTQYPETNIENTMRMFYAIKKANDMKTLVEVEGRFRYDLVVRQRSDVGISSSVDLKKFLMLANDFVIFPEDGHWRGGLNDQFAFSASTHMDAYASVYNHIGNHCGHGCPLHPETLVRYHLVQMKKDPIIAPISAVILRD